ncbi:hypothetical protein F5Y18DRAFT_303512 [Xylariaceae sp. FL1019]|nr:hypothetical protein F5Y18DRAFT_303512 [Xylariaceae sp. FL1019]
MDTNSKDNKSVRGPGAVYLIPWDPDSQDHIDRMKLQRIACGWKVDEVDSWPQKQKKGVVGLHWVVLDPAHPKTPERLEAHFAAYPNATEALPDTCKTVLGRRHKPDPLFSFFHPVGHISLDAETYEGSKLQTSLADGILSLVNFFISEPLQSVGLGGAAMDYCERMARDLFSAKAITLSTIAKEECGPDSPRRIAMKRPIPKITNQDWYARRGYVVYAEKTPGWFDIDEHGKKWPVKSICMRKTLI